MNWGTIVSHPALSPPPLTRTAIRLSPKAGYMLLFAGVILAAAYFAPVPDAALGLVVVAMTLVAVTILVRLIALRHAWVRGDMLRTVAAFVENDAAPSLTTDGEGVITYRNAAAQERFGDGGDETLAAAMGDLFASPAVVLNRLQNQARAKGAAREDVVLRRGHMRLSVHQLGPEGFLWRLEDLGDRGVAGRGGETVSLPMLIASKTGTVLFMNEALRRLLGGREATLDRVFTELPVTNGAVMDVSGKDGPMRALVCEIASTAGRREIYLMPEPEALLVKPAEWGVVDALPVPLLKLDRDGVIVMANRRARALLDDEEAIGSRLADQVEGLGRPVSEWLREANSGRHLGRPEVVRAVKPEEEVFLQISLGQVGEPEGPALVAVLQDATELKTLEAQFVQSQKMQAIGQLAGGVAHDFNNLLTAISGHCDLLLLRHDRDDPDYPDLAQIHQNANRAAALVGQLLAFSRKQTLRPEVIDLGDTLGDLTHLLNRLVGEKVWLDLRIDDHVLPVRADKRQLEQVLMNLVVNARDAMPEGGEIRVETRNLCLDRPLERDRATVPAGDYVTIRVTDQGSGIPPDRLGKIFEPFYTTKKAGQGTGLGLSMAYGIVKQTGGFIFVDSAPGSGSCFTLYFPVCQREEANGMRVEPAPAPLRLVDPVPGNARAQEPDQASRRVPDTRPLFVHRRDPAPAEAPAVAAARETGTLLLEPDAETHDADAEVVERLTRAVAVSGNGGISADPGSLPAPTHNPAPAEGGIVLLVEDEAPVRAFAARALRMRGFTVLEAESAEDALKTLEDDTLVVDIFVTDVIMPGMDGPTWVSRALEDRPGVKVVFVSGYAEESIAEHQARIPNSVYLPKPFSLSELTSVVQHQLH